MIIHKLINYSINWLIDQLINWSINPINIHDRVIVATFYINRCVIANNFHQSQVRAQRGNNMNRGNNTYLQVFSKSQNRIKYWDFMGIVKLLPKLSDLNNYNLRCAGDFDPGEGRRSAFDPRCIKRSFKGFRHPLRLGDLPRTCSLFTSVLNCAQVPS